MKSEFNYRELFSVQIKSRTSHVKSFAPSQHQHQPITALNNVEDKTVVLRKRIVKLATTVHEASRLLAQDLTFLVVKSRWAALTKDSNHKPPLRSPSVALCPNSLSPILGTLTSQFGELVAKCDAQFAAYEVGMLYTSLLPKSEKSLGGIFYSPPTISKMLVSLADDAKANWSCHRFLEPSCGGGVILTAIAERCQRQSKIGPKGSAKCCHFGVGIISLQMSASIRAAALVI